MPLKFKIWIILVVIHPLPLTHINKATKMTKIAVMVYNRWYKHFFNCVYMLLPLVRIIKNEY